MALYIPGYRDNAVIQLIFFCGVTYIMFAISWAIVMIMNSEPGIFNTYFIPNVALGNAAMVKTHWWTFLTYGWFQMPNSFLELVSNMLWLYCFGSVVQGMVGYKQIIPMFVYCIIAGGLVYMLISLLLPGLQGPDFVVGSRAGLLGLAVAAVVITPQYRFYLSETFSIPLMLVAGVFAILQIISTGFSLPLLSLCITGGLVGFGYVRLLKAGYRPGEWLYVLKEKLDDSVTPKNDQTTLIRKLTNKPASKRQPWMDAGKISQRKIDELLDKINQKGYNSLSKEEKEMLIRAGRDN